MAAQYNILHLSENWISAIKLHQHNLLSTIQSSYILSYQVGGREGAESAHPSSGARSAEYPRGARVKKPVTRNTRCLPWEPVYLALLLSGLKQNRIWTILGTWTILGALQIFGFSLKRAMATTCTHIQLYIFTAVAKLNWERVQAIKRSVTTSGYLWKA